MNTNDNENIEILDYEFFGMELNEKDTNDLSLEQLAKKFKEELNKFMADIVLSSKIDDAEFKSQFDYTSNIEPLNTAKIIKKIDKASHSGIEKHGDIVDVTNLEHLAMQFDNAIINFKENMVPGVNPVEVIPRSVGLLLNELSKVDYIVENAHAKYLYEKDLGIGELDEYNNSNWVSLKGIPLNKKGVYQKYINKDIWEFHEFKQHAQNQLKEAELNQQIIDQVETIEEFFELKEQLNKVKK